MASWRTATTTADTSASSLFQTAWLDEQGNIESFDGSLGDIKVEKYYKATELIYKKILKGVVGISSSNEMLLSSDGITYTNYTANIDTFQSQIKVSRSGRYFAYVYSNAWGNYYLAYTDNKTTWNQIHTTTKFHFDVRGNTIVGIGSGSSPNTIRYSTNNGSSWTTSGTIGDGQEIRGISVFSDGKVACYFYDLDGSTCQVKVRILSSVSDTTGTVYNIGGENDITSLGNPFVTNSIICSGPISVLAIKDQNSWETQVYTVTSSGAVTLYNTSDFYYEDFEFFVTSTGQVFWIAYDPYGGNYYDQSGETISCVWEVGGKLWKIKYDEISVEDRFFSSTDGISWVLESTPAGVSQVLNFRFLPD